MLRLQGLAQQAQVTKMQCKLTNTDYYQ